MLMVSERPRLFSTEASQLSRKDNMALRPLHVTPRPSFSSVTLGRRVGVFCVTLAGMSNPVDSDLQVGAIVRLNSDVRENPQLMSLESMDKSAGTGTATWFDYNNGLRRETFPLPMLVVRPATPV
jgi:hypothetical protein